MALVSSLAKTGVTLRLGTDTQQPFVVPGFALHSELAKFSEAGIDRQTSWTWASKDAAAAVGVEDVGEVKVGQRADLLLSASDPFAPDWAPSAISATICGGTALLAADMDVAIQRELGRFDTLFGDHLSRWLARFALNRSAKNFTG
jgi:imidazolonepropionase-like amidohydrolase